MIFFILSNVIKIEHVNAFFLGSLGYSAILNKIPSKLIFIIVFIIDLSILLFNMYKSGNIFTDNLQEEEFIEEENNCDSEYKNERNESLFGNLKREKILKKKMANNIIKEENNSARENIDTLKQQDIKQDELSVASDDLDFIHSKKSEESKSEF